ncbi:hypothetical protein [Herpetosiphon geysericola]|uniref:Uncharacterized protein n=1 Tax=Herpetosiphon geysericola TaxID=70996 RepID=A0A0P6Y521_9CHLR|nr:hypothetical protein [Herpetosiphon geysericola]KPL80321.1 hypothetical protein SE18_25090 [Herpetosiphon geysericola]
MQQVILACGYGLWPQSFGWLYWFIGFWLTIALVIVVKAWVFPRNQWIQRRAPMLKSFLLFMSGTSVSMLVLSGIYFLAPAMFSNRLGFVPTYQLVLLGAICIHDTLIVNYWLKQGYAQTIGVDPNQQLQVEPAQSHWYQPIVLGFGTNLMLFLVIQALLSLAG